MRMVHKRRRPIRTTMPLLQVLARSTISQSIIPDVKTGEQRAGIWMPAIGTIEQQASWSCEIATSMPLPLRSLSITPRIFISRFTCLVNDIQFSPTPHPTLGPVPISISKFRNTLKSASIWKKKKKKTFNNFYYFPQIRKRDQIIKKWNSQIKVVAPAASEREYYRIVSNKTVALRRFLFFMWLYFLVVSV